MSASIAISALRWADLVMEGTFFVIQTYLTDVWKLSFTSAAAFLNIWGGIYRILPISILFLSDTLLGNFLTLTLSAIFSTTGLVLITVATSGGYMCHKKGEAECVSHTQRALFIMGMAFVALGRAARFASAEPFIDDQTTNTNVEDQTDDQMINDEDQSKNRISCLTISTDYVLIMCAIIFLSMPAVAFFAFPYVKKWYLLFGVSAIYTAIATAFYLRGFPLYQKPGPRSEGSPLTDICRVFVAAAFKISLPFPQLDSTQLHRVDGEQFQNLSSSRMLGFLHKAAIKLDDDTSATAEGTDVVVKKRSWRVCSVSEVESTKIMIRMVAVVHTTYLMCGVVASTGNTYFVEQATHMNYNIGRWKPPLQLLLLIFMALKSYIAKGYYALMADDPVMDLAHEAVVGSSIFSVACCTVAAAVERRRLHVVKRHGLLDQPDDSEIPMSAFWLLFQVIFLGIVESFMTKGLTEFHKKEVPRSMRRYRDCLGEGVTGLGFMCGALSVYVVGRISETGSSNNWFQHTLNKSRLDRYYWVLSGLATLNLLVVN